MRFLRRLFGAPTRPITQSESDVIGLTKKGAVAAALLQYGRVVPGQHINLPRGAMSNIARGCGCSHTYVAKLARELGYFVEGQV